MALRCHMYNILIYLYTFYARILALIVVACFLCRRKVLPFGVPLHRKGKNNTTDNTEEPA